MILILGALVFIALIFILFFMKKKKVIMVTLFLILLFSSIFLVFIFKEREPDNENTTFEIKHFSLNDYYADYVFNFKGDFNQIKNIFDYVYNDLKERKRKKEKLVQTHIKSGRKVQVESAKELVLIASNTEEEIASSLVDYEFLRPVENRNPNDIRNLIFKFIIDKKSGNIENIISEYTNTIIKNKYTIESVNDTLSYIYLEGKLNYHLFSESLEVIKRTKYYLNSNIYYYNVLHKNKFIYKIKYFEKGKYFKVIFKS